MAERWQTATANPWRAVPSEWNSARRSRASEEAPPAPASPAGCAPVFPTATDVRWEPGSVGVPVPPLEPQGAPEVTVALQITLAFAIRDDAYPSS
jgi:hypothetical protein